VTRATDWAAAPLARATLVSALSGGQGEWAALRVPAHGPSIAGVDDRAAELADAIERRRQVSDGEVRKRSGIAGTRPTTVDSEAQVVCVRLPPRSGRGGPRLEGDAEDAVPEPQGAVGIIGRELDEWRGHDAEYGRRFALNDMRTVRNLEALQADGLVTHIADGSWALTQAGVQRLRDGQ